MNETQKNRIGQDFSLMGLLSFSFPSILNNFFHQVFKTLDDGLFVSRFVGKTALAGLNILNPINFLQFSLNNLFAVGAPNLSSRKMGEGDQQEAKRIFTRITISAVLLGLLAALLLNIFAHPLLNFLGADEELSKYAMISLRSVFLITPITLVNGVFNAYFSTAGKPSMGLVCSIVNGAINVILDVILIVIYQVGVLGACISTVSGEAVIFIIGLIFFMDRRNEIHFVAPEVNIVPTTRASWKNGLPLFINTASLSLSALVFNYQLLRYVGNDGIAANSIVSDLLRILTSLFFGYTLCVGPIISYNYGARKQDRLRRLLRQNAMIWVMVSVVLTSAGLLLRKPFISIFINPNDNSEVFYALTYYGLTVQYLSLPFFSGCVIIPRMLTAVNQIRASMICAVIRNVVLRILCILTVPLIFGYRGIWVAGLVCEFLAFCTDIFILNRHRASYGYDAPLIQHQKA
ncbi:MAG: MATE family efflux transporter [Anaerolineaceae bacterium]|nr:MATE family efflux transporter [Anaerolineaceae bacterium]